MQMLSVATRLKSTLTTGGLGNPVVATAETAGSIVVSVLAIALPLLALLLLALIVTFLLRVRRRFAARRSASQ